MSQLIALAVGPVQEFIAAARRTRDLWFGSYLLSEISKSVAKSVKSHGTLIFPHPETNLEPGDDSVNVANVILAELPDSDPAQVAAEAKEAAFECWRKYVVQARDDASNDGTVAIDDELWEKQIGDVIEFYTAWVARTGNYKQDRARVMRLLAGRKACRDFPAQHYKDAGIPKSSLDGQRPSVFRHGKRDESRAAGPKLLRLSKGEELDIVGVTKRLGKKQGESGHPTYPSVERVAAESWLQGKRHHPKFKQFKAACENAFNAIPSLNRVGEPNYQYFPFEGTVIYKDRYPSLCQEVVEDAKSALEAVKNLLKELGDEPNPYLAILVADGDRMGAAISNLQTLEENQQFSKDLAGFADEARRIVTKHNGVLVYAGGDDVLAFLPVDRCLCCARELHEDFGTRLAEYGQPTLSLGIAIGHFMENLEDLLDYGRAAEKAAKKVEGKNALAIHLHKRGGTPIQVRAKWDDSPDDRLKRFAMLINSGDIPTKLPYELRSMAKLYERWTNADAAIQQDLFRLIAKKTSRGEKTVRQELCKYIKDMNSHKLLNLAQELLVARMIASALRQAKAHEEVTA